MDDYNFQSSAWRTTMPGYYIRPFNETDEQGLREASSDWWELGMSEEEFQILFKRMKKFGTEGRPLWGTFHAMTFCKDTGEPMYFCCLQFTTEKESVWEIGMAHPDYRGQGNFLGLIAPAFQWIGWEVMGQEKSTSETRSDINMLDAARAHSPLLSSRYTHRSTFDLITIEKRSLTREQYFAWKESSGHTYPLEYVFYINYDEGIKYVFD